MPELLPALRIPCYTIKKSALVPHKPAEPCYVLTPPAKGVITLAVNADSLTVYTALAGFSTDSAREKMKSMRDSGKVFLQSERIEVFDRGTVNDMAWVEVVSGPLAGKTLVTSARLLTAAKRDKK